MDPKAFFAENGYYLDQGVFTGPELDHLEADFDRIVHQITASGEHINARWSGPEVEKLGATETVVLHTHNVQQYSAAWMRAFMSDRFLAGPRALIGDDLVLHHSKLFQKPSENGAPFPMHQDWNYFPFEHDSMIAGIVHVSDADDAMGCLRVYPGTHKLGRIANSFGSSENDELAKYPIENATPLPAKRGDVLWFSYLTIHGSMPNRSDRIRKTVLLQVHAGDDAPEPGFPHPYERLVLSGWNSRTTRNSANEGK